MSTSLPLDQYLQLPSPVETWLIEPLIPAGGLVNLYGPPKVGKSFLALDLARAIGGGDTVWLNMPVATSGNVLYIQLDTPRSLWIDRFKTLAESGVHFTPEHFHVADSAQTPYPFRIDHPDASRWLRAECDRLSPVLVVLDTTREIHQGDENDSQHMQKVVTSLVVASRPAACLLVSHSRKLQVTAEGPAEASLMDDNRGSGYVAGRVDALMQLRGREDSPKATLVCQGRATPHTKIALTKGENQIWQTTVDPIIAIAQTILQEVHPSMRARARALAERTGKDENACRTLLMRLAKKTLKIAPPGGGTPS